MDVRQIRYALTVAKERSFTKASQRLSISQSAVSDQVRLLEQAIGFDLFLRTGRGIELTDRGRTFLFEAERLTAEFLNLGDVATRLKRGGETISIGIGSGLAAGLLARVFSVSDLSSNLLFEIRTASTRVIFDELHAERLDIGVAVEVSPDRVSSGLVARHLFALDMVLIAPLDMAVPMSDGCADLARFGAMPLIMNELQMGYGNLVSSLFNDLGIRPQVSAIADNVETIKTMVRVGVGAAIVPAVAVEDEVRQALLQSLPLRPGCRVGISAYVPRRAAPPHKARLIERLMDSLLAGGDEERTHNPSGERRPRRGRMSGARAAS